MQTPAPFRRRLDLFGTAPSVGSLMVLCEENYGALLRLAPGLAALTGRHLSGSVGQAELLLEIVDQAPYTTTFRLTHLFPNAVQEAPGAADQPHAPEPDALLRAYHDAGQVEVLDLRQTALPVLSHYASPALAAKWRANLFLSKWLGYCVRAGHRFPSGGPRTLPAPARELLSIS